MAVLGNATIAMTCAKQFRGQSAHLARQRTTTIDRVQFLAEEDDVLKKNVLRELGQTTTNFKRVAKNPTRNDPPPQANTDPKGKGKKGNGKKGRPAWQNDWRGRDWVVNDWPRTDWPRNGRQRDQRQPQQKQPQQQQQQNTTQPDQPAAAKAKATNR